MTSLLTIGRRTVARHKPSTMTRTVQPIPRRLTLGCLLYGILLAIKVNPTPGDVGGACASIISQVPMTQLVNPMVVMMWKFLYDLSARGSEHREQRFSNPELLFFANTQHVSLILSKSRRGIGRQSIVARTIGFLCVQRLRTVSADALGSPHGHHG